MNVNEIAQAVKVIESRILTPVIYMNENDCRVEFICFCGVQVTDEELYETGEQISGIISKTVEVVDILEYSENDRLDVILNAELVYSEDPVIEQMLAFSMAEEFKQVQERKHDMLKRKSESGSYYMQ